MAELVEHLKEYSYDRFDILTMWDMNELPELVHTEFGDGNTLADEVLGTILDEDMEKASNSPEAQASRNYQERKERKRRKEVVDKNIDRLFTNAYWWEDNRQPLIGTLVIIASILFAWGFSEILPSPLTQAVGQFYWGFGAAVLFTIVGFLIILKIENRKKPKDTV
jgi:hypothetical protein